MSADPQEQAAAVIWEASRADEGTISVTGAKHVAAVLAKAGLLRKSPEVVLTPETLAAWRADALAQSKGKRARRILALIAEVERLRRGPARPPVEKGVWRHADDGTVCRSMPDAVDWTYTERSAQCSGHGREMVCLRRDLAEKTDALLDEAEPDRREGR